MVSADIIVKPVFQFLDEISSDVSKESSGLEDAVVLKEGWAFVMSIARISREKIWDQACGYFFLPLIHEKFTHVVCPNYEAALCVMFALTDKTSL